MDVCVMDVRGPVQGCPEAARGSGRMGVGQWARASALSQQQPELRKIWGALTR